MGFKTFNQWWPEEYNENSTDMQLEQIQSIIDWIASKPLHELAVMYEEMKPILVHNRKHLETLSRLDFMKLYEQQ